MARPGRRGGYAVRRWDPFTGFTAVDDLFDQMSRMLTSAFPDVARISVHSWSPPVDVQETDDAYVIEADMPGVRPDDVRVDLQGNELRISGEYGTEQGGEQQQSRRSGRFDYRVTLPGEVNAESCAAELDNGVLRLQMPKATSTRQHIPVQAGPGRTLEAGTPGEQTGPAEGSTQGSPEGTS